MNDAPRRRMRPFAVAGWSAAVVGVLVLSLVPALGLGGAAGLLTWLVGVADGAVIRIDGEPWGVASSFGVGNALGDALGAAFGLASAVLVVLLVAVLVVPIAVLLPLGLAAALLVGVAAIVAGVTALLFSPLLLIALAGGLAWRQRRRDRGKPAAGATMTG